MKPLLMAAVVITTAYGTSAYAQSESREDLQAQMAAASTPDYRFEVTGLSTQSGGIGKPQQNDPESAVVPRLVRGRDGSTVTNADVALERVDMGPDGMRDMAARSNVWPVVENPGTYRGDIHPEMTGRWGVTMVAHVTGQPTPLRQTLIVTLAK